MSKKYDQRIAEVTSEIINCDDGQLPTSVLEQFTIPVHGNQTHSGPNNHTMGALYPYKDMSIPLTTLSGKNKKTHRKAKKKGGYPTRCVLLRKEADTVQHTLKVMNDHGVRPNFFLSINPVVIEGEPIAKRKKRISTNISKVGTKLKQLGKKHTGTPYEWHGVTTYESPINGTLHAHHAVHVPRKAIPDFKKWIASQGVWNNSNGRQKSGHEFHGSPFRPHHSSYMTKERQGRCHPSKWRPSAANQFRPQSGKAFRGKRYHFTKAIIEFLYAKKKFQVGGCPEGMACGLSFPCKPNLFPQE